MERRNSWNSMLTDMAMDFYKTTDVSKNSNAMVYKWKNSLGIKLRGIMLVGEASVLSITGYSLQTI